MILVISIISILAILSVLFYLKLNNGQSIPVIMFHGVSDSPNIYHKPELVCNSALFEKFLIKLQENNFSTISLDDLYDFKKKNKKINKNSIVLTFDDGFLDNYVYAAPLLKKYGFMGTIFVTIDFIEKNNNKRKTLNHVFSESYNRENLETLGYCSIAELRDLDSSGILEVNCHATSHSWVFKSDKLVGLYKQKEYQKWLEWNMDPSLKPYQMVDETRRVPFGYPIFEFSPSLAVDRLYIPHEQAVKKIIFEVDQYDGKINDQFINKLQSIIDEYPGVYEDICESKSRFDKEIKESKKWLEEILEREVNHFAFPNGQSSKIAEEKVSKLYKSVQESSDKITNTQKDNPFYFYRIGAPQGGNGNNDIKLKLNKLFYKIKIAQNNLFYYLPFALFVLFEKLNILRLEKFIDDPHRKYDFNIK